MNFEHVRCVFISTYLCLNLICLQRNFSQKKHDMRLYPRAAASVLVAATFQAVDLIAEIRLDSPVEGKVVYPHWFIGFHASQVVQDFSHQQYESMKSTSKPANTVLFVFGSRSFEMRREVHLLCCSDKLKIMYINLRSRC